MRKDNSLLEKLQQEFLNNQDDIRVESLLANALDNGLSYEDFIIAYDNFFYRSYSKDISSAEVKEDANKKLFLLLHLTRCGLYDHLPEGLFYKQDELARPIATAKEMAAEYKLNKQKEREIRKFFVPFENEFFWQRIQLDNAETELLEEFATGAHTDFFIRFWNLPSSLSPLLANRLTRLLPYASSLSGNTEVLAQCLTVLLEETVKIKVRTDSLSYANQNCIAALDHWQLGINTIIGEQYNEERSILECAIGPLRSSNITDYLEGGEREKFLKFFYEYFFPVHVDVETKIEVAMDKHTFTLEKEDESVLGFFSVI